LNHANVEVLVSVLLGPHFLSWLGMFCASVYSLFALGKSFTPFLFMVTALQVIMGISDAG
jgi:hypothetical protein